MNLIDEPWLPFRRRDGERVYAPPSAVTDPDLVDLAFPRADFTGAGWQLLIALLQTVLAPANRKDWFRLWQEPPSRQALETDLAPWRDAFGLLGEGPCFLQDLDPLEEARDAPIASLLIESPGVQGLKLNTDHFVKRGIGEAMCPACAAVALYNFQATGPAGGTGYRVGIRGGGPLTTLVLPHDPEVPLWHKLLLNILPRDHRRFRYPDPRPTDGRIFPWLVPTRTSEKGSSTQVTTPEEVHPLHLYWAMPNRIRLGSPEGPGTCQVCGRETSQLLRSLRMTNLGYNYDGPFRHPLTPYRFDPKKPDETPYSLKGQQGGLGYRHWESLALEDPERGHLPALVVQDYLETKRRLLQGGRQPRLWVFGYDLKQNKPRGWYSTEMPLVTVPEDRRDLFLHGIRQLDQAAVKAAKRTQDAVKEAWFSRPRDAKGDFGFIQHRFWEATTGDFYACLPQLAEAVEAGRTGLPPAVARRWLEVVSRAANEVFESLALTADEQGMDLRRVIAARNGLRSWLSGGREMKRLRQQAEQEAAA
ncbi:type I-E CRISPR-associated protein Cse1/CasA [Ectothiorhodospira mobilis]|uniref:type I-E CRISPR-associated protein Cse1/CasA n=1 Tax=Ectothiorhodospira mobilis TaxID=195064 RepID=UPI001908E345|nr:type I-E CRISPR-associated protein Cse1/CasA [Ectothiorhodospira mobilis]MBK1691210.1 type I-E CRISPR-associated protein Cse1/CasA [Ectothiorhodospira mobilis]